MRIITFAENLKQARESFGMSQAELARQLGISYQTYNGYETKGNEPKFELLIKMANLLGVRTDDLLGYDSYSHAKSLLKHAGFTVMETTSEEVSKNLGMNPTENEKTEIWTCINLPNQQFHFYIPKDILTKNIMDIIQSSYAKANIEIIKEIKLKFWPLVLNKTPQR